MVPLLVPQKIEFFLKFFAALVTDSVWSVWAGFCMLTFLIERNVLPTKFALECSALLPEVPSDLPLRHWSFAARAFYCLLTGPVLSFLSLGFQGRHRLRSQICKLGHHVLIKVQ